MENEQNKDQKEFIASVKMLKEYESKGDLGYAELFVNVNTVPIYVCTIDPLFG